MTKTNFKSGTERRHELISMTSQLKAAAASGKISGATADTPANTLLKMYYSKKGHTELKTYDEWKESGYQVKRGEHALMVWSSKKTFKYNKLDEAGKATSEQGEYSAFSICNLFSQLQVEVIARKEKVAENAVKIDFTGIPNKSEQLEQSYFTEMGDFVDEQLQLTM